MTKNFRIAIISNEWLLAFGLRGVILEIAPLSHVSLFSDPESFTKDSDGSKYDFVFSFRPFSDLKTEIIHSEAEAVEIRTLLKRLLKSDTHTNPSSSTQPSLTKREIDVLRLLSQGLLNKEIADRLDISLHTVISHRKNITSKLGIKTVSGLTIYAMMHGVIPNNLN